MKYNLELQVEFHEVWVGIIIKILHYNFCMMCLGIKIITI